MGGADDGDDEPRLPSETRPRRGQGRRCSSSYTREMQTGRDTLLFSDSSDPGCLPSTNSLAHATQSTFRSSIHPLSVYRVPPSMHHQRHAEQFRPSTHLPGRCDDALSAEAHGARPLPPRLLSAVMRHLPPPPTDSSRPSALYVTLSPLSPFPSPHMKETWTSTGIRTPCNSAVSRRLPWGCPGGQCPPPLEIRRGPQGWAQPEGRGIGFARQRVRENKAFCTAS
ncbi:hypothetical protein LX36DRAFT_301314 [Colletotrichum falcatum]|nr:hypothetical protein LX36DRAFT_301314 [Colletotrichum falcatum]